MVIHHPVLLILLLVILAYAIRRTLTKTFILEILGIPFEVPIAVQTRMVWLTTSLVVALTIAWMEGWVVFS